MNEQAITEAAERVRRIKAGEPYRDVYGVNPTGFGLMSKDERAIIDAYLSLTAEEIPVLVDDEFLQSLGMQDAGINGYSMLLPTKDGGAIVDLHVGPCPDDGGWFVTLSQGYPDEPNGNDDLVMLSSLPDKLTRAQLTALLAALGAKP